jgi:hypothetical protein
MFICCLSVHWPAGAHADSRARGGSWGRCGLGDEALRVRARNGLARALHDAVVVRVRVCRGVSVRVRGRTHARARARERERETGAREGRQRTDHLFDGARDRPEVGSLPGIVRPAVVHKLGNSLRHGANDGKPCAWW